MVGPSGVSACAHVDILLHALHINKEFQEAAERADQPAADDDETFFGSEYGVMLDDACKGIFSTRMSWRDAALYLLGAAVPLLCELRLGQMHVDCSQLHTTHLGLVEQRLCVA